MPDRQLAVSMGDPAGIGPDIILMAHAARTARTDAPLPDLVVFGDPAILNQRAKQLNCDISIIECEGAATQRPIGERHTLPVVPITCPTDVSPGHPDQANAQCVIDCITQATQNVMNEHAAALVTAPISKATLYGSGFGYPGHTEFLAALADRHFPGTKHTSVMLLACDTLCVVPATIHIPLSEVPRHITPEHLTTLIETVDHAMRQDFAIKTPRICVAGINPHAGEEGTLGREEQDIIIPTLETLRHKDIQVIGPLSADTLFHSAARQTYDVVITMYHDQALIPIKTLAFDSAVNITLGLPFVRTSPDHGTAFSIAATGQASPTSFVAAVNRAAVLANNRQAAKPV